MIRSIAAALVLATGTATAGELMDCFNDDTDSDWRYTSTEPEVLRVTDADISEMLERIREHEKRAVAGTEPDSPLIVRLDNNQAASD